MCLCIQGIIWSSIWEISHRSLLCGLGFIFVLYVEQDITGSMLSASCRPEQEHNYSFKCHDHGFSLALSSEQSTARSTFEPEGARKNTKKRYDWSCYCRFKMHSLLHRCALGVAPSAEWDLMEKTESSNNRATMLICLFFLLVPFIQRLREQCEVHFL